MKRLPLAAVLLVLYSTVHEAASDEWITPAFADMMKPVTDKCIEKTGISNEKVCNARKGDLPDDPELKKYLLCIFESFEFIDKKHHEFEYWKLIGMMPKEMKKTVFEMGKGCLHIEGEDYEKACYDFINCIKKADPVRFGFIF